MTTASPGRVGRPAAADRRTLIATAGEDFLSGRRIEISALADRLGLSRTTLYRWFGTREELIGTVVAIGAEQIIREARQRTQGGGARALLATFDAINREIASYEPLRAYLAQEGESALRVLTRSDGIVQPRVVRAIQELIEDEVKAGRFSPPAASPTLAYAIVRVAEAFLYNDAAVGIRGEVERLREVEAALLGIAPGRKRLSADPR